MIKEILRPLVPKSIRDYRLQKEHDRLYREWSKNGQPVPPPHIVKQMTIQEYQEKYGHEILIETGTYMGDMVEAQMPYFKQIYSIELDDNLFHKATKRFRKAEKVTILHGDSGKVLPKLMERIKQPAIFWLDGHYSAGPTAKGEKDCPIYEEVNAIFDRSDLPHILLIDDARDFNGTNDYPTIEDLSAHIQGKHPNYQSEVKHDIIRYVSGS